MKTNLQKLDLIKFTMFISFQKLQKVTNTCIHVQNLNELPPMDNANELWLELCYLSIIPSVNKVKQRLQAKYRQ